MSRRPRPLTIGIVFLALLSVVGWQIMHGSNRSRSARTEQGGATQFQVVKTTKLIRRGTKIEASSLEIRPQTEVPQAGSFAAKEQALGRVALADTSAHVALGTFNSTANTADLGLAPLIPKGMRAITIAVSDEIAVGNWIQPGDRVDILLIGTSSTREPGATEPPFRDGEARTILENQSVLAVGDSIVGASSDNHTYRHVTLAVTPQDAVLVALAGSVGTYHLSLRPRDDNDPTPHYDATTQALTAHADSSMGAQGLTGGIAPDSIEVISGKTRTSVSLGGKP